MEDLVNPVNIMKLTDMEILTLDSHLNLPLYVQWAIYIIFL